jgi:hypothetical protein
MQLRLSFDIFLHYFLISISFLGLCLLPFLTFDNTHTSITLIDTPLQRTLVGLIFGGICLLGMMAVLLPSRCLQILHFRRSKNNLLYKSKNNIREKKISIRGHHPTCDNFSGHIIQLGSKIYCAGCLGMIIGAVIVLFGSLFYFSTGLYLKEGAIVFFWLGFFGVAGGLLHYTLLNLSGIFRLFFNILFVLGSFFLFIGIDMITNNLALDLYVLTLIIYWIIIRIIVSQQRHQKICMFCNLKPCSTRTNK